MTTTIQLEAALDAPSDLHLLPCRIHHDGAAKVSTYWMPGPAQSGEEGVEEARFRGRQLYGRKVPLPGDVRGLVLRQGAPGADGGAGWLMDRQFEELTYWKHDFKPADTDQLPLAMEWLEMSRAVHDPVPLP